MTPAKKTGRAPSMRGDSARMLRRHNESLILSALYHDGPMSRVELGPLTGLGPAAISQLVSGLRRSRLVREAGQVASSGGRPRVLLEIDPDFGYLAGVDLTGDSVAWGLFDLTMRPVDMLRRKLRSGFTDVEGLARELTSGLRELLNSADVREPDLLGMGIGLPKTVTALAEEWSPGRLKSLTGLEIPVFVGCGVTNHALAESRFGAGRGFERVIVVEIGAGADAALVVDGHVERICEWGHTTLDFGGRPCHCGSRGCVEAYVGVRGILQRYHESCGLQPPSREKESAKLSALLRSTANSGPAAALVRETVGYLGAALGNLISLFTPSKVVLTGWAGLLLGKRFMTDIRKVVAGYTSQHAYRHTSVDLGGAGPRAAMIGAAALTVEALLARGEDPRA
ncbi:ROK family transcriptional regulator [Amycolatopsis oliviviridis]|uniref:Sugar kinase n=1 Tax=Amycolatopsis oliviviridis TaxID=1471590 RepID=A0ABQ3MLJ1_9PSEU|nr:ROK family protein [Amycolatopsis oliviviridis]GHH38446.1 sugar kinase [Amycolatopsis oliviviridis]